MRSWWFLGAAALAGAASLSAAALAADGDQWSTVTGSMKDVVQDGYELRAATVVNLPDRVVTTFFLQKGNRLIRCAEFWSPNEEKGGASGCASLSQPLK